jgi:hypothetical protein
LEETLKEAARQTPSLVVLVVLVIVFLKALKSRDDSSRQVTEAFGHALERIADKNDEALDKVREDGRQRTRLILDKIDKLAEGARCRLPRTRSIDTGEPPPPSKPSGLPGGFVPHP